MAVWSEEGGDFLHGARKIILHRHDRDSAGLAGEDLQLDEHGR